MMKIKSWLKSFDISLWLFKLIFVFEDLLKRSGIDVDKLAIVIQTKMLVNKRNPNNPFIGQKTSTKSSNKNVDLIQLFVFGFMGMFYMLIIMINKSQSFGYIVFFIALMTIVLMSSIMEFSTILIDEKDTYVIFPKPINDATVTLSRYLLMFIYVFKISLIFSFSTLIYTFVKLGILAGLLFFVQIIWLSGLLVLLNCLFYLLLFQLRNPYRIKKWIAKFQILVTIFFTIQFYASSHVMKFNFDNFSLTDSPLLCLLPSTWISSWMNLLIFHQFDYYNIGSSIAGLLTPIGMFWLFVGFMSKNFNAKIASMSSSESADPISIKQVSKVKRNKPWSIKLSNIFTKSSVEQSAFRTIWTLTNRFNEFKMRFYPSFGILFAYAVIMILNIKGNLEHKLSVIRASHAILIMVIYYSGLILNSAFAQLSISSKYKAAWIYYVAPIARPGEILSGSFKTVLLKYFTPFYLLIFTASIYLFGMQSINDLILGYLLVVVTSIIIKVTLYNSIPFSIPIDYYKGKWYLGFVLIFVQLFIGGFHYLIYRWEIAVWISIPLALVGLMWVSHYYKRISWSDLRLDTEE